MRMVYSKLSIIINTACIIMLIGMGLYLVVNWQSFPDRIPMHYDFAGNPNRWGAKIELLIMPGIAFAIFVLMTVTERFPRLWNTGVKVTAENMMRVYPVMMNMLLTTKLIVIGVFVYLTIQCTVSNSLSPWFLPIFLILLFGNIIFWFCKLLKAR